MPRRGQRALENHPWHSKIHAAAEFAIKQRQRHKPQPPRSGKATSWACPNCGMSDCQKGQCDGGDF